MTKTITAKFAGTCTKCGQPIVPMSATYSGDSIEWERGAKPFHTVCPTKKFAVIAPVVPGVNQPKPSVTIGHVGAALIVKLLTDAKAHLKFPKASFLAADGRSELRLSLAGHGSKYPGAVQVKVAGNWVGRIASDGTVTYAIANDKALLGVLTTIAANPAVAAAAYGKFSGHCSFCGKLLTDDRAGSSVEVGYGPKCAENYGLPHHPTGAKKSLSPVVAVSPVPADEAAAAVVSVLDSELPEPTVKKSRFKTVGDVQSQFDAEFDGEAAFERRAAFGPGVNLVNVITGERFVS